MFGIKHTEIVCTICSKKKDDRPGLLPACERYLGEHIVQTRSIAERYPFYILSGLYGLIPADTRILNYDHLLVEEEVDKLSRLVAQEIVRRRILRIRYFHDPDPDKPSWRPYTDTLNKAAEISGAQIFQMMLPAKQEAAKVLAHP